MPEVYDFPHLLKDHICPSDAIWLIFIVVQIYLLSFVDFSFFWQEHWGDFHIQHTSCISSICETPCYPRPWCSWCYYWEVSTQHLCYLILFFFEGKFYCALFNIMTEKIHLTSRFFAKSDSLSKKLFCSVAPFVIFFFNLSGLSWLGYIFPLE